MDVLGYFRPMFKFIVFTALLAGSADAMACGEDLGGSLRVRLELVREKLVRGFIETYEPSRVLHALTVADLWETRVDDLNEAERIELNAFLTAQELAPDSTPRPQFPRGSKAEQETERYWGPY